MEALMQHADVPRAPAKQTVQVGFRLDADLVEEIDEETRRISPTGITIDRTQVIKMLLREALTARRKARKK